MTQRFTNPLSKFTTDVLQSLPYATLSFSVSGSSTTKAVYADKSKTTSLGAIVTADSAGNFPPIWLDGIYRATLKSKSTNYTDNPATGVAQTGWPIDSIGDNQNFTAYSAWDATFTYDITTNTFVTGPDGLYYKSIQSPNFNKTPASNLNYWERVYILAEWNANRDYAANILVVSAGLLYKSNTTPNLNHIPPNLSYWDNVSFNASITGPFTATGAITGGSFVTAGGANVATLAASGAITCANVTASGAITGGSFVGATGRLLNVQTITSTGTYTPTTGTLSIVVEMVGGGGGGGSVVLTAAGEACVASGGGAGAYAKSRFTSAFSGLTATIGAGGASASNGGQSSLGGLMTAPGGNQGASNGASQASTITYLGSEGAPSSAPTGGSIINSVGAAGKAGIVLSNNFSGGGGASSALGAGAQTSYAGQNFAALGYGGGGSGACRGPGSAALAGGAGRQGVIIIYEYL